MFTLSENKSVKLLAIFVVFTICISRFSEPLGDFACKLVFLWGLLLWVNYKNNIAISKDFFGYMKAYGFFVLLTIPSIFFSDNIRASFNEFLTLWFWRYVIFVVVVAFIRRRDYLVSMLKAFFLFSGVDCFITLLQVMANLSSDNRGWGFGGYVLSIAGVMCMLLPIALVILMDTRFESKLRKSAAFAVIGIIVGLLCNKSRGAWLTELIVVPIAVYHYLKQNRKYLVVFVLVLLGTVSYMASKPQYVQRFNSITNTTTDHSNADRVWAWKSSVKMIKDHPITGVGLGQFYRKYIKEYKYEQETQGLVHTHNNFIQIIVECGIIGLAGLLYFVGYFLYTSLKRYHENNNPYDILIFTTFFGYICVFGQIDYTLWSSSGIKIMWFLIAVLLKLKETETQNQIS